MHNQRLRIINYQSDPRAFTAGKIRGDLRMLLPIWLYLCRGRYSVSY
jgi:hypothetical protein